MIALSDGTVINQEPVTETLCRESSVKYQKAKIGQDFLATDGGKSCFHCVILRDWTINTIWCRILVISKDNLTIKNKIKCQR